MNQFGNNTEDQLKAILELHDIAVKLFQVLPMANIIRFDLGKAIVNLEVQFPETLR